MDHDTNILELFAGLSAGAISSLDVAVRHGGNVHRTTRDMALLLRNALMRGRGHIEGFSGCCRVQVRRYDIKYHSII